MLTAPAARVPQSTPDRTEPAIAVPPDHGWRRHFPTLVSSLLMAVLGSWRAGTAGLWGDELATWGMTQVGWAQMWELAGERDAVLLPYYAVMHVWTQAFGSSDTALRLPSVLAMVAAAGLVAQLGARLSGDRVGLLAGILFAVLPTSSRYAQEARPYALVTLAAVLSTLLLTRSINQPSAPRLAGYGASLAILGLFHVVALALIPAHGIAVVRLRPALVRRWLPMAILGALPGAVLLFAGSRQTKQIAWIEKAEPAMLFAHPAQLFGVSLLAGAMLALAALSLSMRGHAVLLTCWAVVPTAGIFAAGTVTALWTPRYLLFVIPAWVLLAGVTLGQLPLRRGVAIVLLLAAISAPMHLDERRFDGHGQATREAAAIVSQHGRAGDGIVYPSRVAPWLGRDLVAHYVPEADRPTDLLALGRPRTNGHLEASECTDVSRCVTQGRRIWVVLVGEFSDPLHGASDQLRQSLAGYSVVEIWHPRGLTLALLEAGR